MGEKMSDGNLHYALRLYEESKLKEIRAQLANNKLDIVVAQLSDVDFGKYAELTEDIDKSVETKKIFKDNEKLEEYFSKRFMEAKK